MGEPIIIRQVGNPTVTETIPIKPIEEMVRPYGIEDYDCNGVYHIVDAADIFACGLTNDQSLILIDIYSLGHRRMPIETFRIEYGLQDLTIEDIATDIRVLATRGHDVSAVTGWAE